MPVQGFHTSFINHILPMHTICFCFLLHYRLQSKVMFVFFSGILLVIRPSFNAVNRAPLRINPHSDAFLLLRCVLFPVEQNKNVDHFYFSALSGQSEVSDVEARVVQTCTWGAQRRSPSDTTSGSSSRRSPCCDRRRTGVGNQGCLPGSSDQK